MNFQQSVSVLDVDCGLVPGLHNPSSRCDVIIDNEPESLFSGCDPWSFVMAWQFLTSPLDGAAICFDTDCNGTEREIQK